MVGASLTNRHASNLELFLDLVFVFSVTQITSLVAADVSVGGVAEGALIGFVVWWQWTAFTWAGTAIDFQSDVPARLIVLGMVPAALVMAIAVPQALEGEGVWFASSYLVVQLFVLGLQGVKAWKTERTRRAWVFYAPIASIAPMTLFVGGFFDGSVRRGIWTGVAVMMVMSGLLATRASEGEWVIDPVHFAERHALFVIITLGEVLVAVGATAAGISGGPGLDGAALAGVVSTAAVACALWWSYFGFVPAVFEHYLHMADPVDRGVVARDLGSFGHFPLVFGVILYAVVAKHVVAHADAALTRADRWLLLAAMVSFIGGQLAIQWKVRRRLARERLVGIAAIAALASLSGDAAGAAVIALLAGILVVMTLITWRRFKGTDLARAISLS